jgi:hypothetical protein
MGGAYILLVFQILAQLSRFKIPNFDEAIHTGSPAGSGPG